MAQPESGPSRDRSRRRKTSRHAYLQRRLVALAAIGAMVFLAAGLIGGGDDQETGSGTMEAAAPPTEEGVPEADDGLSPARLAGQRLVLGWEGPNPPRGLVRMIKAGEAAGVILFDDNIPDLESARRTVAALQRLRRPAGLDQPLLVMTDQEGGQVKRLDDSPPDRSAESMGQAGQQVAYEQGLATAAALKGIGVNVDLAPVLDIPRRGGAIDREDRGFGTDAAAVGDVGVDGFTRGLEEGGVVATAKHFPGLGRAEKNTDDASQTVAAGIDELRRTDIAPFERFIDSGGQMVMLGLATYPAYSDRPAAFSRSIATGELRGRLGFEGVSITDGLGAAAAGAFGEPSEVALSTVGAGVDLLLYTDWKRGRDIRRLLTRRLRDGELDRGDFELSLGRVLELRSSFRAQGSPPSGG